MTDEQGNYSSARLQDALSLKTNIVEAVVASYPADMISKIPVTHFVAYPNEQPDALAASARLVLVGRIVQSEKAVASQAPSIRASQVLALKSGANFYPFTHTSWAGAPAGFGGV